MRSEVVIFTGAQSLSSRLAAILCQEPTTKNDGATTALSDRSETRRLPEDASPHSTYSVSSVGEGDSDVAWIAMRRPGRTDGSRPWKGNDIMPAPVVMEYIAEHRQRDLARHRGQRYWRTLFRRSA